jgi:hypothetical protein
MLKKNSGDPTPLGNCGNAIFFWGGGAGQHLLGVKRGVIQSSFVRRHGSQKCVPLLLCGSPLDTYMPAAI